MDVLTHISPGFRFMLAVATALLAVRPALPVEPGIDIAAPRVAITTVNSQAVRFNPSLIIIEQFDHVRWSWLGGIHDTTSGAECLPSPLWSAPLINMSRTFTRLFAEDPEVFDFYCMQHCALGMTGQVVVTREIPLTVTQDGPPDLQLDWSAFGPGRFQILRSTSPAFTAGATTTLTPATGTNATSFLDQTGDTPPEGTAHFYLVMNHF